MVVPLDDCLTSSTRRTKPDVFRIRSYDLSMDGIGETVALNVCDVLERDSRFIPKPQDGSRGIYR